MTNAKTYSIKPSEITRAWYHIDAEGRPLGRVASQAAKYLLGKHKPSFSSHIDCGDYIIITNASKVVFTGNNKLDDKKYYSHSGHPGALKTIAAKDLFAQNPTEVVKKAIRGMLPRNKLLDGRLDRLKIFTEGTHEHEAQKPITLEKE